MASQLAQEQTEQAQGAVEIVSASAQPLSDVNGPGQTQQPDGEIAQ